jgi:hypothetical protein
LHDNLLLPLLPKDAVTSYCGLELGDGFLVAYFRSTSFLPGHPASGESRTICCSWWREPFLRDCSQEHTAPAKNPCGRVRGPGVGGGLEFGHDARDDFRVSVIPKKVLQSWRSEAED